MIQQKKSCNCSKFTCFFFSLSLSLLQLQLYKLADKQLFLLLFPFSSRFSQKEFFVDEIFCWIERKCFFCVIQRITYNSHHFTTNGWSNDVMVHWNDREEKKIQYWKWSCLMISNIHLIADEKMRKNVKYLWSDDFAIIQWNLLLINCLRDELQIDVW